MSASLEFPEGWRGGGVVLEKIPSMGEVWIFSGITQYENRIGLRKQVHCMWSVEVGNITREFFFFSHRSLIRNNTQTAVCVLFLITREALRQEKLQGKF